MSAAASIELPPWACVSAERRAHIAGVVALLERWACALRVAPAEARGWREAGLLHDALRDAPEASLRALAPDWPLPVYALHGPAVAARLEAEGEARVELLDAIRWHTVGHARWARTGRALYLADYLEPGRPFARAERAALAARVEHDFEAVYRDVARQRLARTVALGEAMPAASAALWEAVR